MDFVQPHHQNRQYSINECRHGTWCVFKIVHSFCTRRDIRIKFSHSLALYIVITCVPNVVHIGLLEIPTGMDFVQPPHQNRQYFINDCRHGKWSVYKNVPNFCSRQDIRLKFSNSLAIYFHNLCAKFGAHQFIRNTHCYCLCKPPTQTVGKINGKL